MTLKDKRAVVTGGSSGIGLAISRQFVEEGAHVDVLDVNLQPDEESLKFHQCDITNQRSVDVMLKNIAAQGSPDILVNNAGIGLVGDLLNTSPQDMDKLFSVNVKGVYNCCFTTLPYMLKKGEGVILNMASVAGSVGIKDRFAYSMTKGAVIAMTYSIAKDYIDQGIRCNCISPARVHTPFVDDYLAKNYPGREQEMFAQLEKTQPIGRMGIPLEIAKLATFLCSDQSSFITGTDVPIDGGFIKLNS